MARLIPVIDFSMLRVMTEEAIRKNDHRPAMVVNKKGINIIPSIHWDDPPAGIEGTLSHESIHLILAYRITNNISKSFDNLPLPSIGIGNWWLYTAGIYGWGTKGMKWREEMLEEAMVQ